jgi:hypothetical protein
VWIFLGAVARASCRTSQLATWHCIKKELGIIGAVADDQRVFLWGDIGEKNPLKLKWLCYQDGTNKLGWTSGGVCTVYCDVLTILRF